MNQVVSYLNHLDWRAAFQWYVDHLNINYLVNAWEQGRAFAPDDWLSVALLGGNFLALLALVALLVKLEREKVFHAWFENRRAQLTKRPPQKSRTKLEAKVNYSRALQQVYNLHRLAMYDHALNKYRQAIQSAPYDLNTYLVGIKIISEMDELNKPFVQFLKEGIAQLHEKRPDIWKEVARYGREKAPSLAQWQPAA